jgi:hypothetical protein
MSLLSFPGLFKYAIQVLVNTRVFWMPIILVFVFWRLWIQYINARFITSLSWSLLEIKLPREILKSPRAMELFLNTLHQTKDGNLIEKYWQGFLRPWFSLEIVSVGGNIHFFICAQKFFRNLVEAQIYAQYPDVEIKETDDYSKMFFDNKGFGKEWGCWGTEFALTAEDAYPIKTYVDYGLDDTVLKEEQKIDPITSFLEFMGSLKDGEQAWFQILIRATKTDWKEAGKKIIEKIMEEGSDGKEKADGGKSAAKLTPGKRIIIEAVERDVSKLGFDTGIRAMYLAKNDVFNPVNIASLVASMKQYNTLNLNGFKPTRATSVDYLFKNRREQAMKKEMLNAYRLRSYFYIPYEHSPFVLNTEELATIFHFPGRVAETPTFGRIEAKKSEAPANLPV